jgi:penicillin amidase
MRIDFLRRLMTAGLLVTFAACGNNATKTDESDAAVGTDDALDAVDAPDSVTSDTAATPEQAAILGVKQTDEFQLPGLSAPVQVIRTENNVAHIYAANRKDLMHAAGFIIARDRFFQMELARRLGLGTLTELLGDAALSTDLDSRATGSAFVADNILKRLTPEQKDVFDGFAAGINDYIDMAVAGKLQVPSEIDLAGGLLGGTPATLMKKWDTRAVAGAAAAIFYNLGFETDDIGRTDHLAALAGAFAGKPLADLRTQGALADIENHVAPIRPISSAAGLGLDLYGKAVAKTTAGKVPGQASNKGSWLPKRRPMDLKRMPKGLPHDLASRMRERSAARELRNGHDRTNGFGSNAWSLEGKYSSDGRALSAGDGHLPLSVPSLFYQIGLDDEVFGGGNEHTLGLMIPGLPIQAVGTNGHVAWNQTQLVGDITDWYREEMTLDANGAPLATKFKGADVPLTHSDETYTVANIPALGSVGRTVNITRWATADGRWIYGIEGPTVDAAYVVKQGETLVNVDGKWIVPKDTNGDGKITAISFAFTGLFNPDLIGAVDGFGHAKDVFELRDATRHLMGYSQNIAAADTDGHVFYTGFQAVPCRKYLPRDKDGVWLPGASPKQLIDGTKYPSFKIPQLADGTVDDSYQDDPIQCVVPFDEYPNSIDPDQGFILTANNDPGNLATDNNLFNDKWYIGGPWANSYRAGTISENLKKVVAAKNGDVAAMQAIQANNISPTGTDWSQFLLDAVEAGKAAAAKTNKTATEQRIADLYSALTPTDLADAVSRVQAWQTAGWPALSGVETFYHTVAPGELEHAVATTIFAAWFGHFMDLVFNDEPMDVWEPWGGDAHTRALAFLKDGRGPGNPKQQASWNPDTQESAYFDLLSTPVVETSNEIALMALKQGLDAEAARFKTADHSKWIWGMRHGVHFDSILKSFLGNKPDYAAITDAFAISPDLLPLADNLKSGDPRLALKQFPRGGDAFVVDAAGGVNADEYGSGPVFRMVWALGKKDGKPWIDGENVLPGGQSGLTSLASGKPNPQFSDQAKLWLANKAIPMRFAPDKVAAGAIGRELLKP